MPLFQGEAYAMSGIQLLLESGQRSSSAYVTLFQLPYLLHCQI